MGVEALTRVFEHAPHDGKPLIILLALADMANAAGVCWPGNVSLALYSTGASNISATCANICGASKQAAICIRQGPRALPQGEISRRYGDER